MNIPDRILVTVIATAAMLGLTLPVAATVSHEPASLVRLTERSDLAIHGTIEHIESFSEDGRIFTRIEVVPTEVMKGEAAPRVTLQLYGGSFGNTRTFVVGGPCMNVGEEVVLFLRVNGEATFDVVNLAEGKFRVVRSAGEPVGVERDLSGIQYLDLDSAPVVPGTLQELKSAIRSAAMGVNR